MKLQNKLNVAGQQFARPTRFTVTVVRPSYIQDGSEAERSIDILCKAINIPEVTHTPLEMVFKGHTLKIPVRTQQAQTVTMTFYVDERYEFRRIFQEWIDILDNRYYAPGNYPPAVTNTEKYGTIIVHARDYDESPAEITSNYFEYVYPITLSDIEYSSSDKDTIMEFSVTFAFFRNITSPTGALNDAHDAYLDY